MIRSAVSFSLSLLALTLPACTGTLEGNDVAGSDSGPSVEDDAITRGDSGSTSDARSTSDAHGSDTKTGGDAPAFDTSSSTDTSTPPGDSSSPPDDSSAPPTDTSPPPPPPPTDSGVGTDTAPSDGGLAAGWLYTKGNHVYVSDGAGGGSVWVGRGVNMDDIFLCGYDNTLWMTSPETTLESIASGLISGWKATFVRVSLSMASYTTTTSWLASPSQYKTPMTNFVHAIGATPGVYVLVTLRSDASMIGQDMVDGDPEATGLPSDSTTTPDATKFPTGTDATYVALVDTFAHDPYVLFGITNEPGGNKLSNTTISNAMSHAVGVIRAEEDKLGVPHHVVSVQGNGWTGNISFYASSPLPYDNVVYEVHGYPPAASSYTFSTLPVIIGEYGSLSSASAFFADVEAKQIPTLAWDFEPYSDCTPDLLVVTHTTTLTPTSWGTSVRDYLLAH